MLGSYLLLAFTLRHEAYEADRILAVTSAMVLWMGASNKLRWQDDSYAGHSGSKLMGYNPHKVGYLPGGISLLTVEVTQKGVLKSRYGVMVG